MNFPPSIGLLFTTRNGKVKKVISKLNHEEIYILHNQKLQVYLHVGMKAQKVLKFKQFSWVKPYTEFNVE